MADRIGLDGYSERTPRGMALVSADGGFRQYQPEWLNNGETDLLMQTCEEWVGDRWEGFVSILDRRPARQG